MKYILVILSVFLISTPSQADWALIEGYALNGIGGIRDYDRCKKIAEGVYRPNRNQYFRCVDLIKGNVIHLLCSNTDFRVFGDEHPTKCKVLEK